MKYIIKSYADLTKDEVYNMLKIRNEVFVVEQNCAYQDCDGKDLNSFHLFMLDGDTIVGYLRILSKGVSYKEVSIGRVLIRKPYRGKNYGLPLMTEAINYIRDVMNESEIRISAQAYLKEFYEKFGFVQSSGEYLEDDIPHLQMFKQERTKRVDMY